MLAGVGIFGVVDGSNWRSLLSPTVAYRPAILFGLTLIFGWRGFAWSQLLLLGSFVSFSKLPGALFLTLLYLVSHACALLVARKFADDEPWLWRERSALGFLAAAFVAPALPAFMNGVALRALGISVSSDFSTVINSWLRGGAGVLAIAPAVLVNGSAQLRRWVGLSAEREWRPTITTRNLWELVAETVLWSATLWITVLLKVRSGLNVTYLTFVPALAFTLFRGMRFATLALAANAIAATTLWYQLHWSAAIPVADLRLLLVIYSITILVLAAAVEERHRGKAELERLAVADTALRASEEHFRTLANSAPVMMWIIGTDKLCKFSNKPWLDFTGYRLEEKIGHGWDNIVHPDDLERTAAEFDAAFAVRRNLQIECRFRRSDGEYRWMLATGVPLYRGGEFDGFIGSSVDITSQKLAAERLRESEARLAHAQRLSKIGSFERDIATGTMHWSEEKLRILGLERTPPNFAASLERVHPNDRAMFLQIEERVRSSDGPVEVEYRVVRPQGEVRVVRSVIEGIRNDQGALVRVMGASQDITDVRRAQEQTFARQKLETLGTLANGIAHDFNNLLGGVLAQAELALSQVESGSAPFRSELETIRTVAMRGAEIVHELMIYAGTETSAATLLDLSKVVENMSALLKVSVSKHAAIQTELARDLPLIQANSAAISQLAMNLVTNASEAIGNREGIIHVSTRSEGDSVILEVADNGCGISPEIQARIFEPFFSTKSTSRGLGLSVVEGIVRNLGGVIEVESEVGKGAIFRISMPRVEADCKPVHDETTSPNQTGAPARPATVLFVEDEDHLRQAASKMLKHRGVSVLEAADGSAALDVIRSQQAIDILILDITIPGASSRDVFEEAQRLRPEMKVIVASAYPERVAVESLKATIQHFLRKPYRITELVDLIRHTVY